LWEFWLLDSGVRPEHCDPQTGNWKMEPDTGVVLVLMPALETDKSVIHPFFCAKYELTQGQWLRAMGANPSEMSIDVPRQMPEAEFNLRLDVALPLNDQWVYFATAGHDQDRWTGDDVSSLFGKENVDPEPGVFSVVDGIDGFVFHAPVGSLLPNEVGAFDILGNVSEWVRDPRDTAYPDDAPVQRFIRGGDYQSFYNQARAGFLGRMIAQFRAGSLGFRVARSLRPCPWGDRGPHEHE
jgi:formylglycine-generating enzyme required for sulfatase activity